MNWFRYFFHFMPNWSLIQIYYSWLGFFLPKDRFFDYFFHVRSHCNVMCMQVVCFSLIRNETQFWCCVKRLNCIAYGTHSIHSCCDVCYDFRIKTLFGSYLPPVVYMRDHVIYVICVCLRIEVFTAHCVVFLRLVYPRLHVSLVCVFVIAPSVFSNV